MIKRSKASTRRALLAFAAALATAFSVRAAPIISEFMAANRTTLADADGAFSDWIEIYNPDAAPADLTGWYLSDSADNLKKWRLPAVVIPPGGYLVVFASNKNRAIPGGELHTNFALNADGEYLGLIKPDGVTVAFEYPQFPAQTDDVSYGVPIRADGGFGAVSYFSSPTPGKPNAAGTDGTTNGSVTFSRPSAPFATDFLLQLSGAGGGQVIRYVLTPTNTGGRRAAEPTSNSPEYTQPLTIDRSCVVRAAVFSNDGVIRGSIATAYYAKIASDLTAFTTPLPVLVIDSFGSGSLEKDGVDHPAWMYVYNGGGSATDLFTSAPNLTTSLTATVRGSTSALFPKKGYNIGLTDANGRHRPQSLLNLPANEKWALVGAWKYDPSHVNNALVYTLSNRIGRWAPRTDFVEVFFNSDGNAVESADYAGLYAVTDRIEIGPSRVAIQELGPADVQGSARTGGYIFKIDSPDADEFSWKTRAGPSPRPQTSLVLVAPSASDIAPAQRTYLVDYVQAMEDALLADRNTGFAQRTYLDYIDRPSWVDHHILNTLAANPDAFERSSYFTKNRDGKLQAGPVWDFDRALGSYEDERSFRWDIWSGIGAADVWQSGWWGIIAHDPEFMQDWIDRWQDLRRAPLSNASLLALVRSLGAEISSAATRDAIRWPDNVSPYGSFGAQIEHLGGWMTLRAQWIDDQLVAPPAVAEENGMLIIRAAAGDKLVYTSDGSDPRLLGGDIAPNALVATQAVTVPLTTNIHARSYRDAMKGVYPGSPWSSAAVGANSSPLTPAARLINLSARAIVGSGENALFTGVVVADTKSKNYLFRAVGPGLAPFGITGVVPDPQLRVVSSAGTQVLRNNGWQEGPDAASIPEYTRAVGAFPLSVGSHDAASVVQLSAGSYTAEVSTPSGQAGMGLGELYELDTNGRTVNVSTRAHVTAGERIIGGFVVQGPAYKRILIRAVGPTLADLGFSTALADPMMTIFAGASPIASNDRWDASLPSGAVGIASRIAGAFALRAGSADAALLLTLPPGAYTAEVKSKNGNSGITLLEFYEIP